MIEIIWVGWSLHSVWQIILGFLILFFLGYGALVFLADMAYGRGI